jgi:hypothetical protein
MAAALDIVDLCRRVAERAQQFDHDVTVARVHAYEDPHAGKGGALIIQVAAKRGKDRGDWARKRLRFSQAVRDMLLERGDERSPVVQIFAPDEWAKRDH